MNAECGIPETREFESSFCPCCMVPARASPQGSEAIDFAPVAEGDEAEFIAADVKGVNDAVVACTEPELHTPLQADMGKVLQPPAQFADAAQNAALGLRRDTEEDGVKLTEVDFRGLAPRASTLVNPDSALAQVGFPALNAGNKIRVEVGLVFKVISEPVPKLDHLVGR